MGSRSCGIWARSEKLDAPTPPCSEYGQADPLEELKSPHESGRCGSHQPQVHDDYSDKVPTMAFFMLPLGELFRISIQRSDKAIFDKIKTIGCVGKPHGIPRSYFAQGSST